MANNFHIERALLPALISDEKQLNKRLKAEKNSRVTGSSSSVANRTRMITTQDICEKKIKVFPFSNEIERLSALGHGIFSRTLHSEQLNLGATS